MEMWGDAEGAYSLKSSDTLASCLYQVTGPAHIPYHDARWQQLLLHYDQLVHLHNFGLSDIGKSEPNSDQDNNGETNTSSFPFSEDVVGNACRQSSKYSSTSSNLAALTLHVARMIRDLQASLVELREIRYQKYKNDHRNDADVDETGRANSNGNTPQKSVSGSSTTSNGNLSTKSFMKKRIELIGKARATCGALNLLRLLSHETIVEACRRSQLLIVSSEGQSAGPTYYADNQHYPSSPLEQDINYTLKESFTYRSRGIATPEKGKGLDGRSDNIGTNEDGQDSALDLISSIMGFFSTMACAVNQQKDGADSFDILSIPEMYDVVVQILSLLLILLSTQLYQPMVSSAQLVEGGRYRSNHYFLEKWMEYSYWQRHHSLEFQKMERDRMQQHGDQNFGNERITGMEEYSSQNSGANSNSDTNDKNEPLLFLFLCLHWLVERPNPPRRSIASHYVGLAKTVAEQLRGEMAMSPDGMYENHSIVMARIPENIDRNTSSSIPFASSPEGTVSSSSMTAQHTNPPPSSASIALGTDDEVALSSPGHISGDAKLWNKPSKMLINPIRNILFLSSSFFLLPVRLFQLAFRLLGHTRYHALLGRGGTSYNMKDISHSDHSILHQLETYCEKNSSWNMTNNILWLTDSPIADLGSALVLLLSNNCRTHAAQREGGGVGGGGIVLQNPFREELASLNDNRWERENVANESLFHSSSSIEDFGPTAVSDASKPSSTLALSFNFESLFESFGKILHTENGALMLYTMLLSSPTYAASLAARSDLDTLVMPLLRTLYFSSKMEHGSYSTTTTSAATHSTSASHGSLSPFISLSERERPFRSQSQLYVILILLLIFSQDPSFGRDSFRRVSIPAVLWYKERPIKLVSLGSMILLVLLRAISFNLNKLRDEFLLSNCFAVLLNLSPHIVNLHGYVASRLVSVTSSCFKKYAAMVAENGGGAEKEGDLSTVLGMYGETCRTLLQLIKHSIRPKCLEKNFHLVYSLLIDQRDFLKICEFASFKQSDMDSIASLIKKANSIIHDNDGGGMSAEDTMGLLKKFSSDLRLYSVPDGVTRNRADSNDSHASDSSDLGNLTFTYEEETDPEVFFVPYVWDVVVGVLTTTSMEWKRDKVQVFPLTDSAQSTDAIFGAEEKKSAQVVEKSVFSSDSTEVYGVHTPDVV